MMADFLAIISKAKKKGNTICKKPHEKRAIRREIAISVKVSKMAIFRKTAKRGPREIFQKWPIF